MAADFRDWIGRTETARDIVTSAPLKGLTALFDGDAAQSIDIAPPLAHWLYFLPTAKQSEIGPDGHPKRGGFLPPIDLPRRMWAGGRLTFHASLRVGAEIERVSTIKDVKAKSGASGEMVFVTVAHEISANGALAISEEQDIVYRAPVGATPDGDPDRRAAVHVRAFALDEVALFRFSALTFNGHRIHYDRPYATGVERYPGLVVQGPFIAMALLNHFQRSAPDARVRSFSFRGQRPLFDGVPAELCANVDGELWCRNADGVVMSARVGAA
jgi:3-methylfumaryl-CoA hydratase